MIKVRNAASPAILGAEGLQRWHEWMMIPSYGLGSINSAWVGHMLGRANAFGSQSGGNYARVMENAGTVNAFLRMVSSIQVIEFLPAAGAGGAREVFYRWAPIPTLPGYACVFDPTWPAQLEATSGVPAHLSCSISAWIRKRVAGDQPGARQMPIGFANAVMPPDFSRRMARIGLHGDGAGGFRFCSVNCPSAPLGAAENNQTDTDANAVAPAILAAPGTNWFHARIKLISASQSQTGRFLCYLSGRLAATFDLTTNFPKNSRSSIDALADDYWPIIPVLACWGNPDGVTVDPGFYVRDLRVRFEEDQNA